MTECLLWQETSQKATTEKIYANFDASYPKEKQADDYDILLTTDKISEGFNLNRAGMVINYDIPWNLFGLSRGLEGSIV